MKAIISAHCTCEYGNSPQFLELEVTQELIEAMESLQTLCVNGITAIHATIEGEWEWESEEVADELRLGGDDVVVTATGVWFQTNAKHQDGHIETDEFSLTGLRADFEAGKEVVFYGHSDGSLQETYEEAKAVTAA